MKLHASAALSLKKRRLLVHRVADEGWSLTEAAASAEVSERTAGNWVRRYRAEGEAGLVDRSSAPGNVHNRTPEERVQVIAALRRLRFTAAEIAAVLGLATSTVSALPRRVGLGKRSRRTASAGGSFTYEQRRAGELPHIDVKRLGRVVVPGHRVTGTRRQRAGARRIGGGRRVGNAGWEFVHVCVDDASRLAFAEVLPNERATTAVGFLRRCLAFYRAHGISVERVLTDNGSRLHLGGLRDRPPGTRAKALPNAPPPTADQWQGRALHPDDASRVGLRSASGLLPAANGGATGLAGALQHEPKTRRPRSPAADRAATGAPRE
jgi:transposase